jgi:CDP-glucose 4,6-dehydratase
MKAVIPAGALENPPMTPGFWKGRPVLVTGHTGFEGSWLCWWLGQLGAKVAGLALDPPTSPSLFESSGLARAMASVKGGVRELATVEAVFREHRPEIVIHRAAQSLVRESCRDLVGTFGTNVAGTVHCLKAASNSNARATALYQIGRYQAMRA